MCELFGMSSRFPSTVRLSLEEFSRHGGLSGPHKDGWGIAWYEEREIRVVKEARPAAGSACVRFIQDNPFTTPLVLSHVRKATRGAVALRNCQPFVREMGGAWHGFAHNGDLVGIDSAMPVRPDMSRPVGETDSELAFCALLQRLRPLWSGAERPSLESRRAVIERFAGELRDLGPANFLYCDGDALFAHADRRHHVDGTIRAPGLWWLHRHCPAGGELATDGLHIDARRAGQEVVLVASVPLTGEAWVPLSRGEVLVAACGRLSTQGSSEGS
jgi:predicted glutamine amidotransferase